MGEILNLIESVSGGFPSYFKIYLVEKEDVKTVKSCTREMITNLDDPNGKQ